MTTRRAKPPKDPNAPKKPMTSYFLYSNERRSALREIYGKKSVTEISKVISAEWREISNERKETYIKLSQKLREAYVLEFAEYKETNHYREHQFRLKTWKENQQMKTDAQKSSNARTRKRRDSLPQHIVYNLPLPKKPKQPSAMPRKSQSSYFLYSNERRPVLRNEHTNKKLTEIAKLISVEWHALTPERKSVYDIEAKRIKAIYDNKMLSYKQTDEYKEYAVVLNIYKKDKRQYDKSAKNTVNGVTLKIRLPKKPKDVHCPRKPQSSYFLFGSEVRNEIREAQPSLKLTQVAKVISVKWKALTDAVKLEYTQRAKTLKNQYVIEMEKYKDTENEIAFKVEIKDWNKRCNEVHKKAFDKAVKANEKHAEQCEALRYDDRHNHNRRKLKRGRYRKNESSESDSSGSKYGSDSSGSESSSGSYESGSSSDSSSGSTGSSHSGSGSTETGSETSNSGSDSDTNMSNSG